MWFTSLARMYSVLQSSFRGSAPSLPYAYPNRQSLAHASAFLSPTYECRAARPKSTPSSCPPFAVDYEDGHEVYTRGYDQTDICLYVVVGIGRGAWGERRLHGSRILRHTLGCPPKKPLRFRGRIRSWMYRTWRTRCRRWVATSSMSTRRTMSSRYVRSEWTGHIAL